MYHVQGRFDTLLNIICITVHRSHDKNLKIVYIRVQKSFDSSPKIVESSSTKCPVSTPLSPSTQPPCTAFSHVSGVVGMQYVFQNSIAVDVIDSIHQMCRPLLLRNGLIKLDRMYAEFLLTLLIHHLTNELLLLL